MKRKRSNVSHETKLTGKQRRFIDEYLLDFNVTQAAIRAGYSKKTAAVVGHEVLRNPKIKKIVDEKMQKNSDKTQSLKDRVIREMERLAFHDVRKIYDTEGKLKPIHELDDETAAAVAGVEIDVELSLAKPRKINQDGEDEGDEIQKEITRTHKVKLADKGGALVSLARHLGMFDKDKVKVVGDKNEPLVHKIDAGTELADIMTLEQLEEVKRRVIAKSNTG